MSEREPERKERQEHLEYAWRSLASENHPGRDEDVVIHDPDLGLIGVCDGMGGYEGGREAAECAARSIRESVKYWDQIADDEADQTTGELLKVLVLANDKVIDLGHTQKLAITDPEEREKFHPPGTTAAVAKVHEFADGRRTAYIANVGDSRVYVWRAADGRLDQVTQDDDVLSDPDFVHTMIEKFQRDITAADIEEYRRLLDTVRGEAEMPDALGRLLFRYRRIIMHSLGGGQRMAVRTYAVEVLPKDVVFVTSDGVHDNLTRQRIEAIVATSATVEALVERLTVEAYEHGHTAPVSYAQDEPRLRNKRDDITVVAVKIQ